MKIRHITIGIGSSLLILGAGLIASVLYFDHKGSALPTGQQTASSTKILKPQTISGYPVELNVPSLNIRLRVVDGVYNPKNGSWTLSKNNAHFALPSAVPNNEQGNTLIYGHYRPEVFARLKKISVGEKAIVTTNNGYKFSYTFKASQSVDPADTSIFGYEGSPQLTIQTCSGAFMQNRQLYTFEFDRYEKI